MLHIDKAITQPLSCHLVILKFEVSMQHEILFCTSLQAKRRRIAPKLSLKRATHDVYKCTSITIHESMNNSHMHEFVQNINTFACYMQKQTKVLYAHIHIYLQT